MSGVTLPLDMIERLTDLAGGRAGLTIDDLSLIAEVRKEVEQVKAMAGLNRRADPKNRA